MRSTDPSFDWRSLVSLFYRTWVELHTVLRVIVIASCIVGATTANASLIYLTDDSNIYRYDQSLQDLSTVIPNLVNPGSVAVANNSIYWIEGNTGSRQIRSASTVGSDLKSIIHTSGDPYDVAVDAQSNRIYWSDSATMTIRSANLDGSNVIDLTNINLGKSILMLIP